MFITLGIGFFFKNSVFSELNFFSFRGWKKPQLKGHSHKKFILFFIHLFRFEGTITLKNYVERLGWVVGISLIITRGTWDYRRNALRKGLR